MTGIDYDVCGTKVESGSDKKINVSFGAGVNTDSRQGARLSVCLCVCVPVRLQQSGDTRRRRAIHKAM